MPTPLRTPQTSGHYASRISDLPLRSLKSPPSHGSKIIIFYFIWAFGACTYDFFKKFRGQRYKNEEDSEECSPV